MGYGRTTTRRSCLKLGGQPLNDGQRIGVTVILITIAACAAPGLKPTPSTAATSAGAIDAPPPSVASSGVAPGPTGTAAATTTPAGSGPKLLVEPAGCPPVPTDVAALVRLTLGARLGCFSGRPITFQARLVDCNCDVDGGSYEPHWFNGGSQPVLFVEPSEIHPPTAYEDWLIVRLDPAGRYPEVLPVGKIVEVTGMFDHPAALGCLFQGIPIENAGSPAPTSDCRSMFATTSLVALQR